MHEPCKSLPRLLIHAKSFAVANHCLHARIAVLITPVALQIAEQAELRKMEERKLAALEQKKTQLEQLEEVRAKLLAER